MRISVFGLGYVGCVSAACLAREGHAVMGVDVNPQKVNMVLAGQSPIIEPGLDDIMAETVAVGDLKATLNGQEAIQVSDVSMICVGTPSNSNGSLDLRYVEKVCREIGEALPGKADHHVVVVRSTVLPGTVRELVIPILEENSGKQAGTHFGVAVNPEFLREGSAIDDYYDPSLIVVGELDRRSGDVVEQVYEGLDAPCVRTTLETAEIVKYVNNAFHALKVAFANEIGNLCKGHGVDGREVMHMLCQDHRLNISPAYLKPGFAFGGSCLPKDLRALLYRAKDRDIDCSLLSAVLPSNKAQIQRGVRLVERTGLRKVGILGLSFKGGTDDVRESPMISLIETLVGRGYQVRVCDQQVELGNLIGSNRAFLERVIPHIASLMRGSLADVLDESEVVVIAHDSPTWCQVPRLMREDQVLIDLVGSDTWYADTRGVYDGICW
jgi:GDP-mannose 6-dehydrogenase